MKFLIWLFDINNRHRRDIIAYQKGGRGRRIFVVTFSLTLLVLTVLAEILFINTFNRLVSDELKNYPFLSFLGAGLLALMAIIATVDFSACYAITGFKMAIFGIAYDASKSIAGRIKNKKKQQETVEEINPFEQEIEGQESQEEKTEQDLNDKKSKKWEHVLVGILELAFAVLAIASAFLTPMVIQNL